MESGALIRASAQKERRVYFSKTIFHGLGGETARCLPRNQGEGVRAASLGRVYFSKTIFGGEFTLVKPSTEVVCATLISLYFSKLAN